MSQELYISGDYLNGGDKSERDFYKDCIIVASKDLTAEDLLEKSEQFIRSVLANDRERTLKHFETISGAIKLDVKAKKVVKALEVAVAFLSEEDIPPLDDLLSLIKEKDISEDLQDILFSILMLVSKRVTPPLEVKDLYDRSPQKTYSTLVFIQYSADKAEIEYYWNSISIIPNSLELLALTRGCCRLDEWNRAFEFAEKLIKIEKSDYIQSLYYLAQATDLALKYQGKDFYSLDEDAYGQVVSCAHSIVNKLNNFSDKHLLLALGNLLAVTQNGIPQLIDSAIKYREKLKDIHPSVYSYIENFETSVPLDLKTRLRSINSNSRLSLYTLQTLTHAYHQRLYVRMELKNLVLRAKLDSTNDLIFAFNLILLQAQLISERPDDLKAKLNLKDNIKVLESLAFEGSNKLSTGAILEISRHLLALDLAKECCQLLKPRIPEEIWLSAPTKLFFAALLQSEQTATLSNYLTQIENSSWDAYLWGIQARIYIIDGKWSDAKYALEEALSRDSTQPYLWETLIKVTHELTAEDTNKILDRIPLEIFSVFDDYTFSLLYSISRLIDPHYSEQVITDKFISNPKLYAPYLLKLHFYSLSDLNRERAIQPNNRPLNKVIRSIELQIDNEAEEKLIVDMPAEDTGGAIISIDTEYGDILSQLSVGEETDYGMTRLKVLSEPNYYAVAFRYALELTRVHPSKAFPLKQIKVDVNSKDMFKDLRSQMLEINSLDNNDQILSEKNLPLFMRGRMLERSKPVVAALKIFSNSKLNHDLRWISGDVSEIDAFITDIYGLLYLALCRYDIAFKRKNIKILITKETFSCINEWLKDVERDDYFTLGIAEEGLVRTLSDDIQRQTSSIRTGLRGLLQLATVENVPIQDTPQDLLDIRDSLDLSTYSTMKYALFTGSPYFIMDSLFHELLKTLDNNFLSIDPVSFLSSLVDEIPVDSKINSFHDHLNMDFPVFITYKDIEDLAASDDPKNIWLSSKILHRYSKSFDSFETASLVSKRTLIQPLISTYLDKSFFGINYDWPVIDGNISMLFNSCCQVIIDTCDGRTAEERLVDFTQSLICAPRLPKRYISLVYLLTNRFISGHFLDIEYMNKVRKNKF